MCSTLPAINQFHRADGVGLGSLETLSIVRETRWDDSVSGRVGDSLRAT
jgi:hypothetical protein